MAMQVSVPQRENSIGKLGKIGALILTPFNPLAAGMVAGASSLLSSSGGQSQAIPLAESQGMQRRQGAINEDPMIALTEARSAIQGLEDQFPEQTRALDRALMIGRRNQQLGRV